MKPMTAKAYLGRIRALNGQIDRLKRQRRDLRALMYDTSSPANMNERVQTSTTESRWFALIAKVDEKERDIVAYLEELVDLKEQVAAEIERITLEDKVNERNYKDVLHRYYILGESFEEIAVQMHYSYRWTCTIHGRALIAFEQQVLHKKS